MRGYGGSTVVGAAPSLSQKLQQKNLGQFVILMTKELNFPIGNLAFNDCPQREFCENPSNWS